jgi:hypothetical protein
MNRLQIICKVAHFRFAKMVKTRNIKRNKRKFCGNRLRTRDGQPKEAVSLVSDGAIGHENSPRSRHSAAVHLHTGLDEGPSQDRGPMTGDNFGARVADEDSALIH